MNLSVLKYMLQCVELMVKPMATSVKWSVMLVNKSYRVKNVCKWITVVNVVSINKLSIVLIIQ